MPTIRPYSSTSTAGLVCNRRVTSLELASTSTVGKPVSITSLTGEFSSSRLRTTFASTRFSRNEPTARPSSRTGICVSPSSSIFLECVTNRVSRRYTNTSVFGACGFFVPLIKPAVIFCGSSKSLLFQPLVRMMLGQIVFASIANNENYDRVFIEIGATRSAAARLVPVEPPQKIPSIRPASATSQTIRDR